MKVEQIYTGCLAQGAYFIMSDGEAAVVDPLREIQPYILKAERLGVKIKYVFETHFHADFVSGHIDLAKATGATIVFGPNAKTTFDSHTATDGEEFSVGKLKIKLLHTPGHTMESSCYLLHDEAGKPHSLFTGDTLFIGDVGRPDLAQKSDLSMDDLAGYLYDSLHQKIMTLPHDVIVYPAHGAGSACGKNMSSETTDTLGNQINTNYALKAPDKKSFIEAVTAGLSAPPAYFPENVRLNKEGSESITEIIEQGTKALSPDAFEALANSSGALLLDTRHPQDFSEGFVPNSINIGLDGEFAPWVGALIPTLTQPILFLAPEGREEETVIRLARVGYDNTIGFLQGGIQAWKEAGKELDKVDRLTSEAFIQKVDAKETNDIIDLRREGEYAGGHLPTAVNQPLDHINDWFGKLDTKKHYFIHCAGGYRSMIGASILKARGVKNITDVADGYAGIKKHIKQPNE